MSVFFLVQGIESKAGPTSRCIDAFAEPDVNPPSQDHPSSLHSWLRPFTQQTSCGPNTTTMDALNIIIDIESNNLLLDIYKNVKQLSNKFDSLDNTVKTIKRDNKQLKQQHSVDKNKYLH